MTAEDYLGRVAFMLRDLPWRTRRELVTELRAHLTELPADTDLEARLGPPEQYAADLRSAAGLERRRGPIAFLRARRPRNVVLAILALTVLGLAVGAVTWIQSYQPLSLGNGYFEPRGAVEAPAGGGASVVFHEGRPFRYGFTIRNSGSYAVHVLGVPYPPGLPFSVRVLMSGPTNGGMPRPFRPFHPLDLQPGRTLVLVLEGVYHTRCGSWATGGVMSLTDLPVRFGFLWRTSTTWIRLPEKLAIVFPEGAGCG